MREFFRGWKRKAGCVTLLTTCVLAAGWVRSLSLSDRLRCFGELSYTPYLRSAGGLLVYETDREQPELTAVSSPKWTTRRRSSFDNLLRDRRDFDWRWRWLGFSIGDHYGYTSGGVRPKHKPSLFCSVSYWSIVIPLTLLSAWLLLSKPRGKSVAGPPGSSNHA